MAIDIAQLFNETIPRGMANNADDAKGIGAKFQINVTGAGEWNIDASATGPSCTPGTGAADCTITIASEDFQSLIENPQEQAMKLFFAGKIKVQGNTMLAMKMQKLFSFK